MNAYFNGKPVFGPPGTQFTTDETLTMSDEKVLGVTTPIRGITQAEYDALSEVERKGAYIITDANTKLPAGGDVYSTEETRIGTWIDGKPIYRKVYYINVWVSPSITTQIQDVSELFIDVIFKITGSSYDNDDTINYKIINSLNDMAGLSKDKTKLLIWTSHGVTVNYVILEYTKTTDQGGSL